METKKCNKCRKEKPLSEMDRRRDKKTGEFKYLSCCKDCKAEYQNQYIRENRDEINRKQRESEKRREKSRRNLNHASRCTLRLNLGFANAASKKSRLTAFIKNTQTVMEIGFMTGNARLVNERLTEKRTALSQFLSRQSRACGI